MRAVLTVLTLLCACGDNARGNITIVTTPAFQPALGELVALTPYAGLALAPSADAVIADGLRIEVVDDGTVPQGYWLEQTGTDVIRVHALDVLGAQYGATAALESVGFSFRHPFDPEVPQFLHAPVVDPTRHAPDIRVRGVHLHTLHPIEGYFAVWEPSAGATNDAHRIIDWVIKNRGNYIEWAGLDDILDPARHAAWKASTRELIDYAHARGIRIGIDVQLFGQSNLQLAYDLADDRTGTVPIAQEIAARLPPITDGLPFDVYKLSFGEFFNSDPAKFVDAVNEVRAQLRTFAPQAEMHGLVHLGATQRVDYMGENLIYYFLIKFADPSIIPDIHTTMFFDLFEDAGGAYQHQNFDEHLAYLRQRMCDGQPVVYYPETAYWVAFDNSVPQFLPIYAVNRRIDLEKLQSPPQGNCSRLDGHVIFSSGWEWGYWLNDVVALRSSYERPLGTIEAVWPDGAATATALATTQRTGLMEHHLTGYMSGRDSVIDLGRTLNIISQPDRITFDQLVADPAQVAAFAPIRENLVAYAAEYEVRARELAATELRDDRWTRELRDGMEVDRLRAHFVVETFDATLAHIDGNELMAKAHYASAQDLMNRARVVVQRRHADLHDTHGRRLVDKTTNRTFYQFGYLFMADTLCYWQRELDQVGGILGSVSTAPPSCVF